MLQKNLKRGYLEHYTLHLEYNFDMLRQKAKSQFPFQLIYTKKLAHNFPVGSTMLPFASN